MDLNSDNCYQALQSHDPRFDGVFYVGVRTTGIYCRPVCPAKVPQLKNIKFFSTAAAAEQAGHRPCLRCRPELAPGKSKVDAVSRLAAMIAQRIEDGALTDKTVAALAEEIGISERHLRRVVESEFGVSPIDLAQTQRLLNAKLLLTDSRLSMTEVALASGFSSIRRFNSIFQERYGLSPSTLRKVRKKGEYLDYTECSLGFRPPFDWQSLVQFLSARTAGGAEAFVGDHYVRSVSIGKYRGWIEVFPSDGSTKNIKPESADGVHRVRSVMKVRVSLSLSRVMMPILAKVRRLFDLDADPQGIQLQLGDIAKKHSGLRVPGAFDAFELCVRAILGQQVSVKGATTLMNRYVDAYGETFEAPFESITALSPTAQTVAAQKAEDIAKKVGIPLARARAIKAMAEAFSDGTLTLDHAFDIEAEIEKLLALPGIGSWTAQYIAMRALRWPDAFPHGDLAIRKALKEDNLERVLTMSEQWRPWRAYAAMHLWKSLEE